MTARERAAHERKVERLARRLAHNRWGPYIGPARVAAFVQVAREIVSEQSHREARVRRDCAKRETDQMKAFGALYRLVNGDIGAGMKREQIIENARAILGRTK